MKTIEVKIFKFSELSPKAKERALEDYRSHAEYHWAKEALESIEALAERFGGKFSDNSIDWTASTYRSARFEMPEMERREIENILAELGTFNPQTLRGNGDCKLTGYCMDESAIDGFRIAFKAGESDLNKLMQAAFRSWLHDCVSDFADQLNEERYSEHCEANEYEFDENGKFFRA